MDLKCSWTHVRVRLNGTRDAPRKNIIVDMFLAHARAQNRCTNCSILRLHTRDPLNFSYIFAHTMQYRRLISSQFKWLKILTQLFQYFCFEPNKNELYSL